MKYLSIILFFITLSLNAQTSLAEYDYLTKDYKQDLGTGRNIKSGYKLDFIKASRNRVLVNGNTQIRGVIIRSFKKTEENRIVALLVEFIRVDKGNRSSTYSCIPSSRSAKSILDKAQTDFFKLTETNNSKDKNIQNSQYFYNAMRLIGDLIMDANTDEKESSK